MRLRVLLFGAGFSLVVRLEALLFVAIQPIVGPASQLSDAAAAYGRAPANRATGESCDCGYVDGPRTPQPWNVHNLNSELSTTRRRHSSFDHICTNPCRAARNHGRLESDAWGVGEGQSKGRR